MPSGHVRRVVCPRSALRTSAVDKCLRRRLVQEIAHEHAACPPPDRCGCFSVRMPADAQSARSRDFADLCAPEGRHAPNEIRDLAAYRGAPDGSSPSVEEEVISP